MKRTATEFALAVAAFLAGINTYAAEGKPPAPAGAAGPVTFNKHIAPLVFKHCAPCHRPGEVAPFSLLTYAAAKKRARQLRTVTSERYMPPWKSVAGHGTFVGERRLTAEEIELIARWVKQGAPEGAPQDLPALPRFPDQGWQLGKPDIVVKMPAAYKIPAEGHDIYRNFVFRLDVPKGKYIKAAEYRPSNRRVVHHALLAVDVTGRARKQQADPAVGFQGGINDLGQLFPGSMAGWTPGHDPMPLPDGLSMPWKPGADLVLQLHLHPSGKPEVEQSSIGFYLTDQPPQRSMVDLLLIDKKINIPPGERSYHTRDEVTLPVTVEVLGVFPHMHLIGRDIKLTAYPPHGKPFSLVWIDDWDFNWQTYYQYAVPVKLAAGTRIVLEATHDNSADNIHNPNQPPERVVWGEETTNEMALAFLQVMPVQEADFPKLAATFRRRMMGTIKASGSRAIAP
jgi:mono/diheme cytochrome c family protein